jgi:hypothetical protein
MEIRADGLYRNDVRVGSAGDAGDESGDADETGDSSEPVAGNATGKAAFTSKLVVAGEVFVLNDNPLDTVDSRDEDVNTLLDMARGRVVFRVWPPGGFGIVD